MAVAQCKICYTDTGHQFQLVLIDFSDFDYSMVVGVRWAHCVFKKLPYRQQSLEESVATAAQFQQNRTVFWEKKKKTLPGPSLIFN